MIKIVTVVGARPQIIKAAAISRAIKNHFADKIKEIIVHTGQHYDHNMSEVFFNELGIPKPDYNLNIGSSSHGEQTAKMISGIEKILIDEQPEALVLYGDTNSTLAGAIAASKIHVPIIHIEAGLRSFNKSMPEEINRIMCDHASTLLFSPTKTGVNNLQNEGFKINSPAPYHMDNPGVFHCGDIMYDNSLFFSEIAEKKSDILKKYNLSNKEFILTTIHRNNNTDDPERLNSIFSAINDISHDNNIQFIIPLHPRTSKILAQNLSNDLFQKINQSELIKIIEPVSFLDIILLEKNAKLIMTDSGGVQKEAYFFNKPVIILRPESEWIEIVEQGAGIISNSHKENIIKAYNNFNSVNHISFPPIFGDGKASEFICKTIIESFNSNN